MAEHPFDMGADPSHGTETTKRSTAVGFRITGCVEIRMRQNSGAPGGNSSIIRCEVSHPPCSKAVVTTNHVAQRCGSNL